MSVLGLAVYKNNANHKGHGLNNESETNGVWETLKILKYELKIMLSSKIPKNSPHSHFWSVHSDLFSSATFVPPNLYQ